MHAVQAESIYTYIISIVGYIALETVPKASLEAFRCMCQVLPDGKSGDRVTAPFGPRHVGFPERRGRRGGGLRGGLDLEDGSRALGEHADQWLVWSCFRGVSGSFEPFSRHYGGRLQTTGSKC